MSHSQADPHPKGLLSLSPETLGVVLTFLRSADPPFVPSKVSSTRPGFPTLGWLNVTHVCRYLRSVALEYPALWTTVLCTRNCRLWLPDWLERSKDLPLTVVTSPTILPTFVNTYANAIARAFEDPHHFSRIQRLRIPNADVVTPFLELFLVRPAPQLGTISISRLSDRRRHLLPPGLFAGYAPRLREVNLDGFFVAWWTFKFPTLTHLSIRLPSERCGAEFAPAWNFARDNRLTGQQVVFYRSINALTDALQALPYLVSLKLSNILEQLTFLGQQDVSFSLFLPRLTHLSVTEPSIFFLPNFLDGLRVPRLESLEIDLQRKMDETTANYDKITNFVAKHAQRARSPIISLDTSVDHCEWKIIARTGGSTTDQSTSQPFLTVSLRLTRSYAPPTDSLMTTLLATLPLSEVETLSLHDHNTEADGRFNHAQDNHAQWCASIYARCLSVIRVTATNTLVAPLLAALANSNSSGRRPFSGYHGHGESKVLSALKTLSITIGSPKVERRVLRSLVHMHSEYRPLTSNYSQELIEMMQECLLSHAGCVVTGYGYHDDGGAASQLDGGLKMQLDLLEVELSHTPRLECEGFEDVRRAVEDKLRLVVDGEVRVRIKKYKETKDTKGFIFS